MTEAFYKSLPKFAQVKHRILTRIHSGVYPAGEKLPSQPASAKEFHVTKATLGKAISELVREGVLETRAGMGTFVAKANEERKDSPCIYALIRDLNSPHYARFANMLNQLAVQYHFEAKILVTGHTPEEESRQIRTLLENPDGYVFSTGFSSNRTRKLIKSNGHRFFVFGPAPELKGYTNVITTDYAKGTFEITDYLFRQGHRNIAYIGKSNKADYSRFHGFEQAHTKRRIQLQEKQIISTGRFLRREDDARDKIIEKISGRLIALLPRTTAVLCQNDHIAIYLMIDLLRKGVKIPEQLSFCSFDGALHGVTGSLRITSALQPLEKMLQRAIHQVLHKRTADRIYESYASILFEGNTVVMNR
ncbi:MAG: substrate-binding domain-containing protein [Phycisphaerae bacterium]|nr:substrate-binding domain-containing protein [Phycisphaerae bacterium]